MEKYINIPSYWGTARNEYISNGNDKLAVILPGTGYTNMAPFLYYSLNIALESGFDGLAVEYGFQRGSGDLKLDEESASRIVSETKQAVNICLEEKSYNELLFIGKSLGTFVQMLLKHEYSEYRQRHILLTPLPECIGFIKQTECMVAAGTKDKVFPEEYINGIAGQSNVELIKIEGADHRLETGDYKQDLRILTEVCGSVYEYINDKHKDFK